MSGPPAHASSGGSPPWREAIHAWCELATSLDEQELRLPTRLPGWSVQDNIAHVTGGFRMLLGRPRTTHTLAEVPDHVRNRAGKWMEVDVDERRGWMPGEVVAELCQEGEAVEKLLTEAQRLSEEIDGPLDSRLRRKDLLPIAVFDWWVHEQDVRLAVGRPGHVDGAVPAHAWARMAEALETILPARVEALAGRAVEVIAGGHGSVVVGTGPTTATIRTDILTLTSLCCGRSTSPDVDAALDIDGDAELAHRVVAATSFTP